MWKLKIPLWIIVILLLSFTATAVSAPLKEGRELIQGDSLVDAENANQNFGLVSDLEIRTWDNGNKRGYILINISNSTGVTNNLTFLNATLNLRISNIFNSLSSLNLEFYYSNESFDEENITWNSQACGTTFGSTAGTCNTTLIYSINMTDLVDKSNISIDFTERTDWEIKNDDGVFLIFMRFDNEPFDGTNREIHFNTKENSNFAGWFNLTFVNQNTSVDWLIPEFNKTNFIDTSLTVSLNVSSNARNRVFFELFNSSRDLIDNITITNTGTGVYFYNNTFTGLGSDHTYYIHATHIDPFDVNTTTEELVFYNIIVNNCSNPTGIEAINFTILDEQNSSRIDGTVTGTFDYNDTNPTKTHTVSITQRNNFSVCIFPVGESIFADYDLTVTADGYQQRKFSASVVLTNNTQLINLTLLEDADGIFGRFQTVDSFQNILVGVTVTMKNPSTNQTLQVETTDDSGIVTFFADPDVTYSFKFEKTGFETITKSVRITSSDVIGIVMTEQASAQEISIFSGVDYFFLPSNTALNNKTGYNFTFNLTSSIWNITACTLSLKNTTTTFSKSHGSNNGSICSITISFNTGNQTLILSEAVYQLNGTKNSTVSYQYSIKYTYVGQFSLMNFFEDLKNFGDSGFNNFTRSVIAFLVIFGVVAFAATELKSTREPEILIMIVLVGVMFFSFLNWFNIPFQGIPDIRGLPDGWLNQWMLFILTLLGSLSYLLRRAA